MDRHKRHKTSDYGDVILEDIYQVLCDISDKLNGESEDTSSKIELKEPKLVTSESFDNIKQEEDRPKFEPDMIAENENLEFVCEICGRVFKSERGLKIHKFKTHGIHV